MEEGEEVVDEEGGEVEEEEEEDAEEEEGEDEVEGVRLDQGEEEAWLWGQQPELRLREEREEGGEEDKDPADGTPRWRNSPEDARGREGRLSLPGTRMRKRMSSRTKKFRRHRIERI